jgi:ABC-type lipoprotein export system ATPase subunit
MNTLENIVETHDIWRIYQTGSREVQALRGITFQAPAGRFIAFKGRSGSGKTTLLNCLGGLDQPNRGTVTVNGLDLSKMNDRAITSWRSQEVGFVFQSFGLLPTFSAYENVEFMLRLAHRSSRERHKRALEVLDMVGLTRWIHHRPYEMSGGQQQRVTIARALANRPRLILADEPTGELDSTTARDILSLFRNIVRNEAITILIASHDPLVDNYVDEVLQLKDGQFVDNQVV